MTTGNLFTGAVLVNKIICVLLIIFLFPISLQAATINASSASYSDVNTAVGSAVSGDTVVIPAGSATWSSTLSLSEDITIQGNGVGSTVITCSGNREFIDLNTTSSRITGIEFQFTGQTADGTATGGARVVRAEGHGWRVDNCKFDASGSTYLIMAVLAMGETGMSLTGISGLVDNCEIINGKVISVPGNNDRDYCNYAWTVPLALGTSDAVYIEDCTFVHQASIGTHNTIDSDYGSRMVVRFNEVTNGEIMQHSWQPGAGESIRLRGSRSWEIYGNELIGIPTNPIKYQGRAYWIRGGTGVLFGNTLTGDWNTTEFAFDNKRSYSPYNDAGYCDGTEGYDENANATGWWCRDQIGTIEDDSLWSDWTQFPDSQDREPAMVWNNDQDIVIINSSSDHIQIDRDYFEDSNSGVSTGTSLPGSCSNGQGFWKTNEGSWNQASVGDKGYGFGQGVLYKCVSGSWQSYYEPYDYPHPLRSGETPSDETDPTVTIDVPTTLTAYDNETSNSIYVCASITDNVEVSSAQWSNVGTGGSGPATCSGSTTNKDCCATISLSPGGGSDLINFTGYDSSNNSASDPEGLTVSWAPVAVIEPIRGSNSSGAQMH